MAEFVEQDTEHETATLENSQTCALLIFEAREIFGRRKQTKFSIEDIDILTVNFVLAYPSSSVLFHCTFVLKFKGYVLELHKGIIVLVRTCMNSTKHVDCSHSGRTLAFYLVIRLRIFLSVRKV
jgi:hypothetical protein